MSAKRWAPLVPLAVALVVAAWLLWAGAEPSRQGGYCTNASIEVVRTLQGTVDISSGAAPPVSAILDRVEEVDVARFQVDTPAEIAPQVELVATERSPEAFALVLADYLERCGAPS